MGQPGFPGINGIPVSTNTIPQNCFKFLFVLKYTQLIEGEENVPT